MAGVLPSACSDREVRTMSATLEAANGQALKIDICEFCLGLADSKELIEVLGEWYCPDCCRELSSIIESIKTNSSNRAC